jgi:tripartite-type tricarboxylate transporter receptor subunit TctC
MLHRLLAIFALSNVAIPALAQDADFYKGKTINLIIGSAESGMYDSGGRLMARLMPRYIPGAPTIVPRNMPGASSVRAAEFLYNVAPKDGLTLATVQPSIVLNKVLDPAAKYEPEKYVWIGRVQPVSLVGSTWHTSGVMNTADARTKAIPMGASGAQGTSAMVPWALNALTGTKFNVVRGYQSSRQQILATEKGELGGVGSTGLTDILARKDWMDAGHVKFIYSISRTRSKHLPDVPALPELADNDFAKQVLGMLGSVSDVGQTLMGPPGMDAARTPVLRRAFDELMKDKEFVAEAAKLTIDVEPQDGPTLEKTVASGSTGPKEVLDKLREVTRPPEGG